MNKHPWALGAIGLGGAGEEPSWGCEETRKELGSPAPLKFQTSLHLTNKRRDEEAIANANALVVGNARHLRAHRLGYVLRRS